MRIDTYDNASDRNLMYINGCGIGDKRMKLDELPYERVKTTYAVSSIDASRLGKALENVVYMPNEMPRSYGKHKLDWPGIMTPVRKKAGKFDMPMDNPAVSAEAQKNMQELSEQCVETVSLCERVFEGLCHQNYQNAVKAEDHARARFWQEQLAILRPHVPAA